MSDNVNICGEEQVYIPDVETECTCDCTTINADIANLKASKQDIISVEGDYISLKDNTISVDIPLATLRTSGLMEHGDKEKLEEISTYIKSAYYDGNDTIPCSEDNYTETSAAGWNYHVYDESVIHMWGKIVLAGFTIETDYGSFYHTHGMHIPLPVRIASIQKVELGTAQFTLDSIIWGVARSNFEQLAFPTCDLPVDFISSAAISDTDTTVPVDIWAVMA